MNINLCEHIYVYLCLYAYMYVCMYVCTHVCIHCNLCRCILDVYCIRTYDAFLICVQRTNNQTNTHTHRYTHRHTHTHTHTHTRTHTHTDTHTQRHTHTQMCTVCGMAPAVIACQGGARLGSREALHVALSVSGILGL